MKKSILKLSILSLLFLLCVPMVQAADAYAEPAANIESEMSEIQISVSGGNTIHVKNAEGFVVEVYSITGAQILAQRVDSNSKDYEVSNLQKGCYIVKVGKVTRKVYIK